MNLSIVNRSKLNEECRLDAEFYSPDKLHAETLVCSKPFLSMVAEPCRLIAGPFGSTVTTDMYVKEPVFRYIRGKDIQNFFIDESDPVFVGKGVFEHLPQFQLQESDLLVTVVGMNFGKVALVFSEDCPAIFSCKSTVIRNPAVNPIYLSAFLSCRYGHSLLRRGRRGAAQPGINLFDLRHIPVPVLPDELQSTVQTYVLEARERMRYSKALYSEASKELLTALNLNSWKAGTNTNFVSRFKQVIVSRRMDAEYFQPKYTAMLQGIPATVRLDRLGKLVSIKKGLEVGSAAYSESGVPFWRVSNLTRTGLDKGNLIFIDESLYENLRTDHEPRRGEILLSKDATPGVAFFLEEDTSGIVSGGILRLNLVTDIEPHYLELVLNSTFVQMQIERESGGSVIRHWKPSGVKGTLIPRLGARERDLAGMVQESHRARKESNRLLDRAKRLIEDAIEAEF